MKKLFSLLALVLGASLLAQTEPSGGGGNANASVIGVDAATPQGATDPSYELAPGDSIVVSIYNEQDMSAAQRIDDSGLIRLPLVDEVALGGLTVREAERTLENLYKERELLRMPLVTIRVSNYAIREVSVLGAVRSPGTFRFPVETTSLDIVDLVTRLGGLLPTARGDQVRVTRRTDGRDNVTIVDVDSMINRRRGRSDAPRDFAIYPGDRIWVPERLF